MQTIRNIEKITLKVVQTKFLAMQKNIYIYTVGTESIQTPLHFSLFVILQPFAKII